MLEREIVYEGESDNVRTFPDAENRHDDTDDKETDERDPEDDGGDELSMLK